MLAKLLHHLRIYSRLQLLHLQIYLEYEADFWVGIVGAFLRHTTGFVFIWAVFSRVPQIKGWNLWEMLCLYALSIIPLGLVEVFYDGQWRLVPLVSQGEFDRLLIRPISPALQVITQISSIHGFGSVILGIVLLGQAVTHLHLNWRGGEYIFLIATLINSAVLLGSLNFISNCWVFWDPAPNMSFPLLLQNMAEFAKYPLDIYGKLVQTIVTWVLPFAFVSYYPGVILLGKPIEAVWLGYLAPLSGPVTVFITFIIWRKSLARYQGAGH